MDSFPHFKFFHNRKKRFMLSFADGLIDESCNLQFSSNKTKKYSMQTSDAFETFYS